MGKIADALVDAVNTVIQETVNTVNTVNSELLGGGSSKSDDKK